MLFYQPTFSSLHNFYYRLYEFSEGWKTWLTVEIYDDLLFYRVPSIPGSYFYLMSMQALEHHYAA